jgi:hypothetical protein
MKNICPAAGSELISGIAKDALQNFQPMKRPQKKSRGRCGHF